MIPRGLSRMQIPNSWVRCLKDIQKTFPDAVIAGGCLRDLDLGRAPKDIDIFVPRTTHESVELYLSTFNKEDILRDFKSYGNFANKDVARVVTMTHSQLKADGLNVELIAVDVDKTNVMSRFDFGICQICYDGDLIKYTGHYLNDKIVKRFRLLRCDNQEQFDRSLRRWESIKSRYEDFTFDPGEFGIYYDR